MVQYELYGDLLEVFIEADLKTYMRKTEDDKPDVYSLPTNMRTPYQLRPERLNEGEKPIVFGDITLTNIDSYMEAQQMVSEALKDIFEFCHENDITVFFPIVGRTQRVTHFQLSDDGKSVVALPPDIGERAQHPGSDQVLSQLVLEKLVGPVFDEAGLILLDELKYCTPHNATYLADVLAVIVGIELTNDPKWWKNWKMDDCEIATDGKHSKPIFGTEYDGHDVPYCKANFVASLDSGLFRSMDSTDVGFDQAEFKRVVEKVINGYVNGSNPIVYATCVVIHDAFACDIDDLPAKALLRTLTAEGGFTEHKTWREA